MAGLLNSERYTKYYKNLTLMYQRPEVRAPLEVILSVVMVAVLISLAIRPTLSNIVGLQKKIADQETVDVKADKKIAQLFNAQSQLSEYSDKLILYDRAVADKLSYFDIVSRMEILTKRNNLLIDQISAPGSQIYGSSKTTEEWMGKVAKKEADGSISLDVNISVYGLPKDIRNFLGEVENMDRLSMIRNVLLSKEKQSSKEGDKLKATLQIRFYFYDKDK
jgi:hypothetical protein